MTTIIYIRTANRKGQEVSAYIDYAQRLKTDNFEAYFDEVGFPDIQAAVLLSALLRV